MDKPIYFGFSVIELSKLSMYETYHDKLQPYIEEKYLELHYTDCDSFVLSIETQNTINHLKNLEGLSVFSTLNENYELISNKNKKVVGKIKVETSEKIWIDEFVRLRSKSYSFKCGNKITKKLKGISKFFSKNNKLHEYKKCLDEEEY